MEETVVETWIGIGMGSSAAAQPGVDIVEEGRGGEESLSASEREWESTVEGETEETEETVYLMNMVVGLLV